MLFDRVATLPLAVDSISLESHERDTSSGFTRKTTTVELSGEGYTGRGEDVTYETDEHTEFQEHGPPSFTGEFVFAEFADAVAGADLFRTEPAKESARRYRRWAFESAALDLALKQKETSLAEALDMEFSPVNFVVSTRLGEPPSLDRLEQLREIDTGLEFKLDPTDDWDDALIQDLAEMDCVRILDLKARYSGTEVDQEPDLELYQTLLETFSETIMEDPGLTDDTRTLLTQHKHRLSWDVDITGVESIQHLPWDPEYLNIKPSRFGSVEAVFDTIEYCQQRDVTLYGGGQFELGVGREQIQALASLCYPDGPNDVAPGVYNLPIIPDDPPTSLIEPPADVVGFGWDTRPE